MADDVFLTIEGEPGTEVTVRYRGTHDDEGEGPSPIVCEAALRSDGRLLVRVPRAYLVILSPHGTHPLALHEQDEDEVLLRL